MTFNFLLYKGLEVEHVNGFLSPYALDSSFAFDSYFIGFYQLQLRNLNELNLVFFLFFFY